MKIGSVDPLAVVEVKKTRHKRGEIDSAAHWGNNARKPDQ